MTKTRGTLKQLMDSFVYSEVVSDNLAYDTLKKHTEENFSQYPRYGILQKNATAGYDLLIYQKPHRAYTLEVKEKLTLDIVHEQIKTDKPSLLTGLVLLQKDNKKNQTKTIHLQHSIKTKKEQLAKPRNIYHHDHFVYISFLDTKNNHKTRKIFEEKIPAIKKQFNQTAPFTFHAFLLTDKSTASFTNEIASKKIAASLKKGSIYLIFDGHCVAGNDSLSGEHEEKSKKNYTEWKIPELMELIRKLHIPKNAFLDIDFYSCEAGQGTVDKPSFIYQFKKALYEDGYTNVAIFGNTQNVYDASLSHTVPSLVLSQAPEDVIMMGTIREPLSSIEKLKNTETYITIINYPVDIRATPTYKLGVGALKAHAALICHQCDTTLSFDAGHRSLKNNLTAFVKINKLAHDNQEYALIGAPSFKATLLHRRIEQAYLNAVKKYDFTKEAYELEQAIVYYKQLDNLVKLIYNQFYFTKDLHPSTTYHYLVNQLLYNAAMAFTHCHSTLNFKNEFLALSKRLHDIYRYMASSKYQSETKVQPEVFYGPIYTKSYKHFWSPYSARREEPQEMTRKTSRRVK